MAGVVQDSVHHAEGDVFIHTRMVLDALWSLPAFHALPQADRDVVWAATALHDVAKPWTTKVEDGKVTARGHSSAGAKEARQLIYRSGEFSTQDRESICNLIRLHQLPFFATEYPQDEAERKVISASLTTAGRLLGLVNRADGLGRVCDDPARLADNVALYEVLCEELGVLDGPYPFVNDSARLAFLGGADRFNHPPERFNCELVVMCGLPGSGKSTWIKRNLPNHSVVSLDDIRADLKVDPTDAQGVVAAEGRERLRSHLRAHRDVVWDATNVTLDHRARVIRLGRDYGARVRVAVVEVPYKTVLRQNKDREDSVPAAVIDHLIDKFEYPTIDEAHLVQRL
jgi:putative nucleotidyltransferase with HDIG domain